MSTTLIPPVLGVLGLIGAFIIYGLVKRYPEGTGKVKSIAESIHLGAMVFMRREYTVLAIFSAIILVLIFISPLGWRTALAFIVGALSSASAGYIGMYSATKANVRTTTAAHEKGAPEALTVAFLAAPLWVYVWLPWGC